MSWLTIGRTRRGYNILKNSKMLRLKRIPELFTNTIVTIWAWLSRHWPVAIFGSLVLVILLWGSTIYANLSTRSLRYDLNRTSMGQVPSKDVAMVFGAGVAKNGQPTPYLQWRIETAVKLYQAHRVHKILMTGDNSTTHYNEPVAMQRYAIQLGVPSSAIVLDYAGFNTYDSCYRAAAIFKVKSAIIVTQGYHLPRAVMACNSLGVPSVGVDAVPATQCSWSLPLIRGCDWSFSYIAREWLSTDKIVLQLIFKPHPTLLGKVEPIQV